MRAMRTQSKSGPKSPPCCQFAHDTLQFIPESFDWSIEYYLLRKVRGLSFEEVVFRIQAADVLDIIEHANQKKYPGQRVFIVNMEGYACLVPYIKSEETIFLKTGIPSRKMTARYLGSKTDETH